MKKFYAFAAAALVALGATAADDLYICGDGEGIGWDPAEPATFEFVNGEYVLEIAQVNQFKISTAFGTWDDFNTGALSVDGGDVAKTMLGTPQPLVSWGENTALPWKGDYTVKVAGDLSTITLTTTTPDPDPEGTHFADLYLRGSMTDSWGALPEWLFTTTDGEIYKFVCPEGTEVAPAEQFKVAGPNWGKYNFGNAPENVVFLDAETPLEAGADPANFSVSETWNGVCYFQLSTLMVFFSNDKDAECPFTADDSAVNTIDADNAAPVYYNLQGVRVANAQNGLFIVKKGNKTSKVLVK